MDAKWKTFVTLAGLLVQIAPYLGLWLGVFQDPLCVLVTLIAGGLTLLWLLVFVCSRVEVPGSTLDSSGDPQRVTRAQAPVGYRIAVMSALLVNIGWLGFVFVSEGKGILDPVAVSSPVSVGRHHLRFVEFEGAEDFARETGELADLRVQETYMLDWRQPPTGAIRRLMVDGGGYLFTVTKRPRVPWVQIDEIRVVVERHWKDGFPKPVAETLDSFGYWQSTIFVAELQPPDERPAQRICRANCIYPVQEIRSVYEIDTMSRAAPLPVPQIPVIAQETPFPILVLLTAAEPGVYQYRLEIIVSCLRKRTLLRVAPSTLCLVAGPLRDQELAAPFCPRAPQELPGSIAPAEPHVPLRANSEAGSAPQTTAPSSIPTPVPTP